jgi:hypothetical protein
LNTGKLSDYRFKQKILYVDKADPETLRNYADLFFTEGNFSDALDFYSKANYTEGLQTIKNTALESGDTMLFQRAAKMLNLELKPSDWESIAQKATALKKYSFARHALANANNEEALNALQKMMEAEEHEKHT